MPSYFYHLAFELYSHSPSAEIQETGPTYLPPRNADIFKSRFPSHPPPLDNSSDSRSADNRSSLTPRIQSTPKTIKRDVPNQPEFNEEQSNKNLETSNGTSPTGQISGQIEPLKQSQIETGLKAFPADLRLDRISMDSIDMAQTSTSHGKDRGHTVNDPGEGPGSFSAMGKCVPLDSKNTELGWGIVHLYRDTDETPELDDDFSSTSLINRPNKSSSKAVQPVDLQKLEEQCTTLCILAVPSYLTPSDFLGFVGEKTRDIVSHFRMIRTKRTNRYMVLMKFRSPRKAKEWKKEWNGKLFNSMEPENCHVVFVKSIEFRTPGASDDPSSFPDNMNDPFTPKHSKTPSGSLAASSAGPSIAQHIQAPSLSTKPLAPATPSLKELPTCPVCLERMDETTGLLTILCQHVFHCACLQKWRGSGCPVCRYTQGDGPQAGHKCKDTEGDNLKDKTCSTCGSDSNLWICLICGNVGCGRYDEAHAFYHYEETSHSYAMDIDTQRVWDYAGDGYVHRLIQNKSDGKLVELPGVNTVAEGADASARDVRNEDLETEEKGDNLGMEYTYLLTSQLDSQRRYFEEKVAQAADKASEAANSAAIAAATAARATEALASLQTAYDNLVKDTMPALEKDKARAERRGDKFSETARRMEKEWREEKAMSASLLERVEHLSAELATSKLRTAELEESNRDLSFFISGQQRLGDLGEEIQEGRVTVAEAPTAGNKKKKGKGKHK